MLLAFGHKARHGKDTAGEAVVQFYNQRRETAVKHGYFHPGLFPEARLFKFADELYRVCREEYGMTTKDAPLLQKVGDGRREEFGLDYWIKRLAAQMKGYLGNNLCSKDVAVITDMRYTNEAVWVEGLGGHTINVRRLNADGTLFVTDDRDPNFISEVQLDGYNYEFHIQAKTGQSALVGEVAVTIAEYVRALES